MNKFFLYLATVGASLACVTFNVTAADALPLQALATCQQSWLDWKDDAPRMARFADQLQTRFTPGDSADAFRPNDATTVLGYRVSQVFPQSVGMGVGFSTMIQADFSRARDGLEKQLGRKMTCSISDGAMACELKLGDRKTAVLINDDSGKSATTLLGCYYYYQQ